MNYRHDIIEVDYFIDRYVCNPIGSFYKHVPGPATRNMLAYRALLLVRRVAWKEWRRLSGSTNLHTNNRGQD